MLVIEGKFTPTFFAGAAHHVFPAAAARQCRASARAALGAGRGGAPAQKCPPGSGWKEVKIMGER